jgi:putative protein kinase ArgK-like GTPase of G3E family
VIAVDPTAIQRRRTVGDRVHVGDLATIGVHPQHGGGEVPVVCGEDDRCGRYLRRRSLDVILLETVGVGKASLTLPAGRYDRRC